MDSTVTKGYEAHSWLIPESFAYIAFTNEATRVNDDGSFLWSFSQTSTKVNVLVLNQ